jgi:conjugal transfer ATP-binding protein TraC
MNDRAALSLPDLLPWHSFDPAGLFVMRDGSLGVAWFLTPVETEALADGALASLASTLDSLLRLLPVGSAAQFLLSSRRDVRTPLAAWRAATTSGGLLAGLARSRADALGALDLAHEGTPLVARSFELAFTLRVFPPWPSPFTLSDARTHALFEAAYDFHRRRLLETALSIESLLSQAAIGHARFDADALVGAACRALNPGRDVPPPSDRPDRLLAEEVAFTHVDVDSAVHLGPHTVRVLSCVEVPRETWAGMLQRAAAPLDHLIDGTYVLNIECRDPEAVRRQLAAKKRLAFCQMSSGDARADVSAIKSEVDQVLADMYTDGARPYGVRIHALVRGPSAPVLNAFGRAGLQMAEDDAFAGTLFLQSLPLAYDPSNDRALRRGRVMMGANLAHLLPLYGSFRGTASPDLLLLNRRGEPITFSFFDSDVAPHGVVAGVSGSGKSVFANALVASVTRLGAHVFILDRGNSYRKLTRFLGGDYVALDPSRPRSINPCGRGLDEEKLLFLTDIVAELCTQGQRELTVKERALVGRSVSRAFEGVDREVLVGDLRAALLADPDPAARDLGVCLEPFCGRGPYAGFFDRPREVDFERPLVAFELGEIAKRRDVAGALLMAVIHNITRFCADRLELRKLLLVDEAWTLLRSANTAQFLEDVLRTYRKLNASALMVTQQVGDFEGRTGEAIRANAPNRVFLRQTPETVQSMERLLDLSPAEKELLSGLVTVKGSFSEMLVTTPSTKGIARLVPDPLLYWLATSDPVDNTRLDELCRSMEDADALAEAARRWPHGARGA